MWLKDEKIIEKEKEIIEFIKQMEPTTYYHEPSCSLYIFSERISFSIKRNGEGTQYGARFVRSEDARGSMGKGYVHAKSLEKLENIIKEKASTYYKNRIKLAVEGKTFTYVPKLFHLIYEKPLRRKMEIITELTDKELNNQIKQAFVNPTYVELTQEEMEEYEKELKNKKQRKKPERGVKIGNLKIFVYKNRLDIFAIS
jgi:hypothetical protein